MSGEIEVKRRGQVKQVRPVWSHCRTDHQEYPGTEQASLEMLESCRNVLELISRSQMLQCDVRHAILDMAKTIRRIDRRLAKVEKLR